MSVPTPSLKVMALYRFCRLADPEALRAPLAAFCCGEGIKGTLLLAPEGINGTVAGTPEAIDRLHAHLLAIPGFAGMEVKFSSAETMPFHRMKVRLKREIVTLGVGDVDPARNAGTYVEPADWNALISHPNTVVIDTRNDYEVGLGTFRNAIDPKTTSFTEFPDWVNGQVEALKGRTVAMFCTGGIRCEKATAYLKSVGVEDVRHLKGGILKYLEETPAEMSLWDGECFVFDERVSVRYGLEQGDAQLCRACRRPLTADDRASPLYRQGIACAACADERSEDDRARYAERHLQVSLSARRGGRHIGS